MSTEPQPDGEHPPATYATPASASLAHVGRGLRVVGWVMMVWSGLVMAWGFVFGRPTLLLFYSLLFVMGWQAVSISSGLRTATSEEAAAKLGRGYVRQGWLVLAWIVLGFATAVYMSMSSEQQ